jgi:hypothetical protein
MSSKEPTAGDYAEDAYWADQGVETGTALNWYLISRRNSATPVPPAQPPGEADGGGGGGLAIPFQLLLWLPILPGLLLLGLAWHTADQLIDRHFEKIQKVLAFVAAIGLVLVVHSDKAKGANGLLGITTSDGWGIAYIVAASVGGWAGWKFTWVLDRWLFFIFVLFSVAASLVIYIGLTWVGYYCYLNFFDGTEIAFIEGLLGLTVAGFNWLLGR